MCNCFFMFTLLALTIFISAIGGFFQIYISSGGEHTNPGTVELCIVESSNGAKSVITAAE